MSQFTFQYVIKGARSADQNFCKSAQVLFICNPLTRYKYKKKICNKAGNSTFWLLHSKLFHW